ncbi:MAG: hypothetical protein AB4063_26625 [Crocosphaera sp.]
MKLTCGIIHFTESQGRSLKMSEESKKLRSKGEKTICLLIVDESFYLEIIDNTVKFRAYLDEIIPEYREIFPEEIEKAKANSHQYQQGYNYSWTWLMHCIPPEIGNVSPYYLSGRVFG